MSHTCHWPGCELEIPPKMWGCRKHWYTLPKKVRTQVWRLYRPGQELDKNPSGEYLILAKNIQIWCSGYEAGRKAK